MTFHWAVTALEFAMTRTHGTNILHLLDDEFALLQQLHDPSHQPFRYPWTVRSAELFDALLVLPFSKLISLLEDLNEWALRVSFYKKSHPRLFSFLGYPCSNREG
jgi:hypothetical protein